MGQVGEEIWEEILVILLIVVVRLLMDKGVTTGQEGQGPMSRHSEYGGVVVVVIDARTSAIVE